MVCDRGCPAGVRGDASHLPHRVVRFIRRLRPGHLGFLRSGQLAGGTPVAPIGLPAAHTEFPAAKEVTLQPGGVGNALLQITNARTYPAATCGPVQAQYLIVYRPNRAAPVKLAYRTTACSQPVRMLQISAISLGTGG